MLNFLLLVVSSVLTSEFWSCALCFPRDEESSESVSFSLLRATLCCGKWHSNLHLIATQGTSLIAPESVFSAMLSAVRKSPTAISTQVMSSYCPIYPLTLTKGYWGREEDIQWKIVRARHRQFCFSNKKRKLRFKSTKCSKASLHFWLLCLPMTLPVSVYFLVGLSAGLDKELQRGFPWISDGWRVNRPR